MKGDAAATTASAPETFMILKKNHALQGEMSGQLLREGEAHRGETHKPLMSHCMTPR